MIFTYKALALLLAATPATAFIAPSIWGRPIGTKLNVEDPIPSFYESSMYDSEFFSSSKTPADYTEQENCIDDILAEQFEATDPATIVPEIMPPQPFASMNEASPFATNNINAHPGAKFNQPARSEPIDAVIEPQSGFDTPDASFAEEEGHHVFQEQHKEEEAITSPDSSTVPGWDDNYRATSENHHMSDSLTENDPINFMPEEDTPIADAASNPVLDSMEDNILNDMPGWDDNYSQPQTNPPTNGFQDQGNQNIHQPGREDITNIDPTAIPVEQYEQPTVINPHDSYSSISNEPTPMSVSMIDGFMNQGNHNIHLPGREDVTNIDPTLIPVAKAGQPTVINPHDSYSSISNEPTSMAVSMVDGFMNQGNHNVYLPGREDVTNIDPTSIPVQEETQTPMEETAITQQGHSLEAFQGDMLIQESEQQDLSGMNSANSPDKYMTGGLPAPHTRADSSQWSGAF